ncbi:hypothetical protein ACCS42_09160 [Rhizobium ruizarguesonis]
MKISLWLSLALPLVLPIVAAAQQLPAASLQEPTPPQDRCLQEVPPPDCIFVANPPSSSGGIMLDSAIKIDPSIFSNLPKETLTPNGARDLSREQLMGTGTM